jgi:hypothetical protein
MKTCTFFLGGFMGTPCVAKEGVAVHFSKDILTKRTSRRQDYRFGLR